MISRANTPTPTDVRLPPGPRLPVAVQTLWWGMRPGAMLERWARRYGETFTIRIAREGTWVVLTRPADLKQVFTGDARVFRAGEGNEILLPLVGESSVLLLDEDRHLRQRKLLLPPFHGERMTRYGAVMREIAAAEVDGWPHREPFRLLPRMQALTLEVILRAVLGLDAGARLDALREAMRRLLADATATTTMAGIALVGPRRAARLALVRRALAPADRLLYEQIAERRRDPALGERDDVLSLLLQARDEDGRPMSDEELRDELVTLLVAGHETTATALAWAIERLVRHPSAHERLREEVDAGEEAYADAVIKETLRLRPVIPVVVRRLAEPVEIGGWSLPAGVRAVPCPYLVHRRADLYPEPHAFRPERFLDGGPGGYAWLPFGGGVRRCIGASFATFEMKRVLEAVLSRVDVSAVDARPERILHRAITLSPERGGEVVVRPRASGGPRAAGRVTGTAGAGAAAGAPSETAAASAPAAPSRGAPA